MEGRNLAFGHKGGAEPEDEGDHEEDHALRQRIEEVAPDSGPVRLAQGLLQTLAVEITAIILTGQRSDGPDGGGGFAGKLRGGLVRGLVLLVFEYDNTLREGFNAS